MDYSEIGKRIKARRKELGLTQLQIKQSTGISSGNLSDIENGNKLPSSASLIALSEALSCSTDWILKGDSPEREIMALDISDTEKRLLLYYRSLSGDSQEAFFEILAILKKHKNTS